MPEKPIPGWYVACAIEDLLPRHMVVCDIAERRLLVFQANDEIAVVDDRCCHRGVPLSRGQIRDGMIACVAHGWCFDTTGRCRYVPSSIPGEQPPASASLRTYPAHTCAGYCWVWIGDQSSAAFPTTFDIPEVTRPGFRVLKVKYRIACGYEDALNNLIDVTHVPFVHMFPHMSRDDRRLSTSLLELVTTSEGVVLQAGRPSTLGDRTSCITDTRIRITFAPPSRVRLEFPRSADGQAVAMVACFVPEAELQTTVEATIIFRASDPAARTTTARIDATNDADPFFSLGRILDEDLVILLAQGSVRRASKQRDMRVPGDAMIAACSKHARERATRQDDSPWKTVKRLFCRCGVDVPSWPPAD